MPSLRLTPDRETYDRLVEMADVQRRPVGWQAEVLLRQAVGLPFPPTTDHRSTDRQPNETTR
jgi:hypothetical protein